MNASEIKVVLVDDHQILRAGMRRLLAEQPDFRIVGEAGDGQSAMNQIASGKPDVVVMDVHLPGEDGITLTQRVLAECPGVKVVALSADADLAIVHRALQAGVSAYVIKSNPPEDLQQAIREVMDQRVYLSPQIASLVVQDYLKVVVNPPAAAKPVMTDREKLLLKLVAEGRRNKEIAEQMGVGVKSIETYRSRLMHKLGCASAADLTRYAIREGIVSP
jgi:DNA-binding NarL/FixJ family response regulator